MNKLEQIFLKTEFRLLLFLAYIISLVYVFLIWQDPHFTIWHVLLRVLRVHLVFTVLFSMVIFGPKFLWFFLSPIIAISMPIANYNMKKYLADFKQNVSAEVVIILGHSDWFKLQAWIKPNYSIKEIKLLVQLLKLKRQDFSFFPSATFEDVETIMVDHKVREVYFIGHGDSHSFKLYTGDLLYYCDFNDTKYAKDYAHQIHCGTSHGKSLIDYVVSVENRGECFLFRRTMNGYDVERELKKRIEKAKHSNNNISI